MARKLIKPSLEKQSFFKVLVDDFSQHLRIPPNFIENFNGRSLRKCALRGSSGQWWAVKLEEKENGMFFQDGWEGFVKDHLLEIGDFLVFSYDGDSKFNVTIYDRSACEKDVQVAKRRKGNPVSSVNEGNQAQVKDESADLDQTENYNKVREYKMIIADRRIRNYVQKGKRPTTANDHVEETSMGSVLFDSENSCFITALTKQLYRVTIPKKLAIAEGLMNKKTVNLQDPSGRSWPVKLKVMKSPHLRFDMATGWIECSKANQISRADTLIFEFVKQSVMQLHIFRAQRRKRGRQ